MFKRVDLRFLRRGVEGTFKEIYFTVEGATKQILYASFVTFTIS